MPTYCYLCGNCGCKIEDYRTISKRNDETICPSCGHKMDKCIGTGNQFILKGPGFYQNDYPKKGKK